MTLCGTISSPMTRNKRPAKAGLLRERLKGLEPSTFCMATGSPEGAGGPNCLQMSQNGRGFETSPGSAFSTNLRGFDS